ncbi:sulfonate ABC transporter substrate-binding protein [Brenneria nigrifluens DSM 30175 = ATCC 13028]|uniref:Putative aliphatic sulfonates-binding protein n=2 Tax=Pectobacteriaceae TaxID=1903410 RepID=A0A2U1ULX4_9GAMM|nr:aliphatic sulfonate ABC transporter substrate-binding protein [Brenneria nigrifluens DSM 30175 = ATCC 13028]QCR06761.1 sulfonate ABC transporter substrate-binding protein [Brenneria nigrifluens DSM 30175 = ATCC 13028]
MKDSTIIPGSGSPGRRSTFLYCACAAIITLAALFTGGAHAQDTAPEQLRIGFQKGSIPLVLAKSHQLLEKRFPQTRISWIEFPAGPQMLEALNVGSIDLGSTGDIPPIFAQAARADLLYVGVEPPKPLVEVILVREDSPINSVADLKGRKIAFQKGSSAHNTLLQLLQKSGLAFSDIKPIYLTPADARAAFQQGNVDAWTIWDPYYSAALVEGGVRVLADGTGLKKTGSFYLAARPYTEQNGAFIGQVLEVLTQADALTQSDRAQSVTLLANAVGLPEKVIETALSHRPPSTIKPLDAATIKAQQYTADLFYENRLLPVKVDVAQRVWHPHTH